MTQALPKRLRWLHKVESNQVCMQIHLCATEAITTLFLTQMDVWIASLFALLVACWSDHRSRRHRHLAEQHSIENTAHAIAANKIEQTPTAEAKAPSRISSSHMTQSEATSASEASTTETPAKRRKLDELTTTAAAAATAASAAEVTTTMNSEAHYQPPCVMKGKATFDAAEVQRLVEKYPLSDKISHYGYGTAGFRFKANLMEGLMVRVGIIAALRAFGVDGDVGVMVTASHNDESYNGVKMADPHGGMLAADYEAFATKLVNERNVTQLLSTLTDQMAKHVNGDGIVHIGRDTRSHSPALSELVVRTALSMGATVMHHGIITTPILHHCVLHANAAVHLPIYIPPRPNTKGYLDLLAHAYWGLIQTATPAATQQQPLVVDCACGVGYPLVSALQERIQTVSNGKARPILPTNSPADGPLNDGCGSEFVQKQVQPPTWYNGDTLPTDRTYCASLDGDSDRIVFFAQDNDGGAFTLLDGDKIAVLICAFLEDQLKVLYQMDSTLPALRLGVVQTAYANGASTKYLKAKLGADKVLIAKTGVKHVHHAAVENFDIGIYFEANGHGTVIFDEQTFGNLLQKCPPSVRATPEWQRLRLLPSLINPAVGDALSDLLLVDAILTIRGGWTIQNPWSTLYQDFPSRQLKVPVPNPKRIQTNSNETRALAPEGLQDELDLLMQQGGGRTFVRPSGTEAVVRVYAEATTQAEADKLAAEAEKLVDKYCGNYSKL